MSNKTVTGVDIDHFGIQAVTLQMTKHSCRLLKVKMLNSDTNILAESHALNHQASVKKLIKIRKNLPFLQKQIAMALPETVVMGRLVRFDELDTSLSVKLGLQQVVEKTFPVSDEKLDFDYVKSELGYMIHAVKREVIDSRLLAAQRAGLKLMLVDSEKQALCHYLGYAMACYHRSSWMLIDVSQTHIRLVLKMKGTWLFRHLVHEARADLPHRLAQVLIVEIQRVSSFYTQVDIQGIWLTYLGPERHDVVRQLQQQVGRPVEWLNPWLNMADGVDEWYGSYSPTLAIGAALRGGYAKQHGFDAI